MEEDPVSAAPASSPARPGGGARLACLARCLCARNWYSAHRLRNRRRCGKASGDLVVRPGQPDVLLSE